MARAYSSSAATFPILYSPFSSKPISWAVRKMKSRQFKLTMVASKKKSPAPATATTNAYSSKRNPYSTQDIPLTTTRLWSKSEVWSIGGELLTILTHKPTQKQKKMVCATLRSGDSGRQQCVAVSSIATIIRFVCALEMKWNENS